MIPIRTKKKTVTKIITHSVHFILAEKKWIWKLESLFEVFKSESAGEKLTQKKKIKKFGSLRGLSARRAVVCPEAGWSKRRPPDIPDISGTHFPFFFSSERNDCVPF